MLYSFSIANFIIGGNLKKSKFKKFHQVFSIIASTCTGIQLIFKKIGSCTIMQIDSYTFQCFIHSQLQISELYSNCTTKGDNFQKCKFKKVISYIPL